MGDLAWRTARGMPGPEALAQRPHGTRLRYIGGCRCTPCRAANSRYETGRAEARRRGEWNGIVSADRARVHLQDLAEAGVGYRAVAAASDVSPMIILSIRMGRRRRIRAATERRLLAVDADARGDGSIVRAGLTWRRISMLLREGFSRAEIARRLGYRSPALQFGRKWVRARTALRIERFYRHYMEVE